MSTSFPETDNFGFTRVGEGESLQKDGFRVTDQNWVVNDRLLKALMDHDHTGGAKLADPAAGPTLTQSPTGGTLPAGQTYYYQISYEDEFGLETGPSEEVAITTPAPLGVPSSPSLTVEATGGTHVAGTFRYVLAARTAGGGVTTASDIASVDVLSGTTNRILITLPELPVGATALVIYRSRPGQSQYYYWAETAADDIYDEGDIPEDITIVAPSQNTSGGTNKINVELPGGTVPAGVKKWKIYRTSQPGFYNGLNLVHLVSEGLTEDATEPRPDWDDDGSPMFRGQPRRSSGTIAPPPAITALGAMPVGGTAGQVLAKVDGTNYNAHWVDASAGGGGVGAAAGSRVWSAFIPGTIEIGKVYSVMAPPVPRPDFWPGGTLKPVMFAMNFLDPPTVSPTGAQVGFEVVTTSGNRWVAPRVPALTDNAWAVALSQFVGDYKFASSINAPDRVGSIVVDAVVDETANGDQVVVLDTADDGVKVNFGTLVPGIYVAEAYMRNMEASEVTFDFAMRMADGADTTIFETYLNVVADATEYNSYLVAFTITAVTENVSVKVFKTAATTDEARLDYIQLINIDTQDLSGDTYSPVRLRATLLDPSAVALPDPVVGSDASTEMRVTSSDHNDATLNYVHIREGIETEFAWEVEADGSFTWTASSDQAWCTLTTGGGTGTTAAFTAQVDFSHASLTAGSRAVATITVESAGKFDLLLYVIALSAPTVLGGNANVVVGY